MSDAATARDRPFPLSYRHALRFVLLVGAVSLFANRTCEGARSITGLYPAMRGASAAAVGFVVAFGELISNGSARFGPHDRGFRPRIASGMPQT